MERRGLYLYRERGGLSGSPGTEPHFCPRSGLPKGFPDEPQHGGLGALGHEPSAPLQLSKHNQPPQRVPPDPGHTPGSCRLCLTQVRTHVACVCLLFCGIHLSAGAAGLCFCPSCLPSDPLTVSWPGCVSVPSALPSVCSPQCISFPTVIAHPRRPPWKKR